MWSEDQGSLVSLAAPRRTCLLLVVEAGEPGWRALQVATDLAVRLGAEIVAQGLIGRSLSHAGLWEVRCLSQVVGEVNDVIERLNAAGISAQGVVTIIDRGNTAHKIAELAAEVSADLIVIPGPRFPRLAALLGANVPNQLQARTGRPVLVVTPAPRMKPLRGRTVAPRPLVR